MGVSGASGNTQVTLSWTAPASDGGSAVTGYVVTPSIGGVAQTPVTFASVATTQTVTGLTNGTAYTFTVAAINEAGTGPLSTPSAAVTPATTPGAPTIVSGTGLLLVASLSWTAPASDGGSAVTGYIVTPYLGGVAQTPTTFSSTATTETVTVLIPGLYTFTVTAINGVGDGPASAQGPSGGLGL
jgi:predicted RNA-binding protein with TRAM domain